MSSIYLQNDYNNNSLKIQPEDHWTPRAKRKRDGLEEINELPPSKKGSIQENQDKVNDLQERTIAIEKRDRFNLALQNNGFSPLDKDFLDDKDNRIITLISEDDQKFAKIFVQKNKDLLDEILNEIAICKILTEENAPNIARQLTVIEEGETYFASIQENGGETLDEKYEGETLPINEIGRIAKQVLTAFAHMHSINPETGRSPIVHGDIHSSNFLEDELKEVRLIDFELSTKLGKIDTQNCYCPAELDCPHISLIHPSQDVLDFGCVLFEFATGENPYDSNFDTQFTPFQNKMELLKKTEQPKEREFYDLVSQMIQINRKNVKSASELLKHPFFFTTYSDFEKVPLPPLFLSLYEYLFFNPND